MTPPHVLKQRRRRYRLDPEARARILESNRRAKANDPNPHRRELNSLARRIHALREAIDARMRWLAEADKRLLEMVSRREHLKAISPKRKPGPRAKMTATQEGAGTCKQV